MRIVSGKWRGKRITAPKNLPTRPTTDFGKESLFNILNNRYYFEDLRVLDLFFRNRKHLVRICISRNRGNCGGRHAPRLRPVHCKNE